MESIEKLPEKNRKVLILGCKGHGQSEVAFYADLPKRRVYPYFYAGIKEIEKLYKSSQLEN